jgi:putative pre-16S rRNA nuclease
MPGPREPGPRAGGRVVGIDLGERRIGIALGDLGTGVASPFATLGRGKNAADDAAVIARIAAEQGAVALVVGWPLDMDGTEGAQALKTREWAEAVASASGLPLRLRDERLTSERAERRLGPPGRGRSGGPPSAAQREAYRARVDREAAALILQDELDAAGGETSSRRER